MFARFALAAVVAAIVVLPVHAQTKTAPSGSGATTDRRLPAAEAPQIKLAPEAVVAVVNGDEIRFGELNAYHAALPPQYRQIPLSTIFEELLSAVIDRRMIIQAARKSGVERDDETKRKIAFAIESVLQEAYVTRVVTEQVTDARLKDAYARMVKTVPPSEEVHARHILVDSEDAAKKIIADLDKGADFLVLAKERSKGPSSANAGDLGYFQRDQMVPEFSQAAFALDKGAYTKAPVKTKYGWHVIKIEDKRSSPPPSFEDTKDEIRTQESQVVIAGALESLRKGAAVKRVKADGTESGANKN
ncbi:MAG: parvulin peptidyl-prolyl isomerase [Alphaproteobacteria bacterium]|nr:parvulin peptidyl-prolyl isomerase [Alphaproteobacteria bacterium]